MVEGIISELEASMEKFTENATQEDEDRSSLKQLLRYISMVKCLIGFQKGKNKGTVEKKYRKKAWLKNVHN